MLLLPLRFIPISDPAQAAAPWAWAGQKVTARLAQRSARRDPKRPLGGLGGLVSQLTKLQDVRLSRHIGMASGPRLGVILTSEKLPTIGCSGLHARGLNSLTQNLRHGHTQSLVET